MKSIIILPILLLILTALPFSAAGQSIWTIVTASSDTLESCSIDSVRSGIVHLTVKRERMRLSADSLTHLIRNNPSRVGSGIGYGALAGASAILVVAALEWKGWEPGFYVGAALIGAFYGSLLGSIVGAILGIDCSYDLTGMDCDEKIALIAGFSAAEDD